MTAQEIIETLQLMPHPEGGHYRESWVAGIDERPSGTCIYFLLQWSEVNHWHKIDATEIWHYYLGAPLVLSVSESDAGPARDCILGPDLTADQQPQVIVPAHHWQRAHCTGDYTLVSCTVSPGFQFDGFTLAAPDFDIPR